MQLRCGNSCYSNSLDEKLAEAHPRVGPVSSSTQLANQTFHGIIPAKPTSGVKHGAATTGTLQAAPDGH
jgi:hypothetical protein